MGIHLAVVTDGTAGDRSFDLWRDMKNVQLFQRFRKRDGNLLPCGKVLELVTIEPARALGLDHLIGSLEVGKRADIIAVNVMQPHLAPFVMPVQRLVYHAMGQDVDLVIVDARSPWKGEPSPRSRKKRCWRMPPGPLRKMMSRSEPAGSHGERQAL